MRLMFMMFIAVVFTAAPALAKHGEDDSDGEEDAKSTTSSSGSGTPSRTSSSSAASPTASPFEFEQPANTTICEDLMLQWHSSGVSTPLTITVTNERGTGSNIGHSDDVLISRTLTTNVSASAHQYVWHTVDIPQGSYIAVATDSSQTLGVVAQSAPFFVQAGQDSSCLQLMGGSGSGGTPSSSSSLTAMPMTTTTDGLGPGPSGVSAVPDSTEQGKKLSPAVLGGVVAGVVVGVVILVLVFTLPHYWKTRLVRHARNRRPGAPYYLF